MLAEFDSPGFFDPLLYELSFSAQALRQGLSTGIERIRAINALAPFADTRKRWAERGIDIGIGSAARVATLVHAALRDGSVDAGRRSIARCWTALLEMELTDDVTATALGFERP
jgi:hypothetical protein